MMAYLAEAGFPVPRVYHASGPDLVMERLAGRDMLADLAGRPWLARQHARTLAGLHDRLHAIAAPPSLRAQFGPGDRMLHLDLHPGNVMLTAAGPVVIDWINVAAGSPAADVAMAWLIIATSEVDAAPLLLRPAISSVRAVLLRRFRALVHDDPGPEMARVACARIADRNTRPARCGREATACLQGSRCRGRPVGQVSDRLQALRLGRPDVPVSHPGACHPGHLRPRIVAHQRAESAQQDSPDRRDGGPQQPRRRVDLGCRDDQPGHRHVRGGRARCHVAPVDNDRARRRQHHVARMQVEVKHPAAGPERCPQ
jgi:hypothetical protein